MFDYILSGEKPQGFGHKWIFHANTYEMAEIEALSWLEEEGNPNSFYTLRRGEYRICYFVNQKGSWKSVQSLAGLTYDSEPVNPAPAPVPSKQRLTLWIALGLLSSLLGSGYVYTNSVYFEVVFLALLLCEWTVNLSAVALLAIVTVYDTKMVMSETQEGRLYREKRSLAESGIAQLQWRMPWAILLTFATLFVESAVLVYMERPFFLALNLLTTIFAFTVIKALRATLRDNSVSEPNKE